MSDFRIESNRIENAEPLVSNVFNNVYYAIGIFVLASRISILIPHRYATFSPYKIF